VEGRKSVEGEGWEEGEEKGGKGVRG